MNISSQLSINTKSRICYVLMQILLKEYKVCLDKYEVVENYGVFFSSYVVSYWYIV